MRHPTDNRVHISELKAMSRSPAHYRLACESAREVTRPMTVGAVADAMVFGDRGYAVYPGKVRNGKEWEAWSAANAGKFQCIGSEYEDAKRVATAVLTDPIARQLLAGGEYQRTIQWEAYGLPMAAGLEGQRGGIDLIGYHQPHKAGIKCVHDMPTMPCDLGDGEPFLGDMKITSSTEPSEFARHAWKMLWHCQGAAYLDAANAHGINARRFYLLGAEAGSGVVTVLPVSPAAIEAGRKSLHRWAEMLRQCEREDRWPGYVEGMAEPMDVPEWEREDGESEL